MIRSRLPSLIAVSGSIPLSRCFSNTVILPCCTTVRRVKTEEQITESTPLQIGNPPLRQMMRPVVNQMAALAETSQVLQAIIAGIVIEMGSGQNNAGLAPVSRFLDIRPAGRAANGGCARSAGQGSRIRDQRLSVMQSPATSELHRY